ncbi:phage major capsid protein [Neomegalonema sp.]|uniref:phage major capsid protein n=1 Tax=Neomegalonema sp. TaxID=2039713 RepID=UPI002607100C|nr:phage major capsid protein [Neomegalonema sp.]MDD2869739.1 phage major capsid protein [Neomegalonema sp.]
MGRADFEVKFSTSEAGLLSGYASVFGGEPDSYGDIIARGAFTASLRQHKAAGGAPLLLWQHDPSEPIGAWTELQEDQTGLFVSGRLVLDTRRGSEAYALLKAGALNGLSIGYRAKSHERRPGGGRLLKEIDLIEISLVSIPAASAARVTSVKAAPAAIPAMKAAFKRTSIMADQQNPAPEAEQDEDRIGAVEETVAGIDARLTALEGNMGDIAKSAARIEQKLARPGVIAQKAEDPGATEIKAFGAYARHGDAAGVELKNLTLAGTGGYLAPPDFVKEVVKNLVEFSPVRQHARVISIGAAEARMPKRTGTLTAAWVSETGDQTSTEPAYGEIALTPHEAACFVDVSNALLEDNQYNLQGELAADFAEEFGRLEGLAFVSGSGVGQPAGILADADIEAVESGVANAITADSLIDLFHDLPGFYAANAVWGMNRSTIGVVRKLKNTGGDYLWRDTLSDGNPPTILGRPVIELPDMPDIAADATPILFGDLKQGYRIVDRLALSVMRDPYSVATKGQTRFHARRRVGGAVIKPEAFRLLKVAV